ncbi:TetR/AcrR family transcriptional regulator [Myceligenerans pegani]|uniref:TetR/AcrR family transcriptional regulator n=1 Tax=Myceligenerans pegani TaxID=2776917 RepID=A0ABR9MTH8_9MICO|nr:TetR/AcrR family transcriptional regulator [Myceligenerans sp. TRM 65318]MBE1874681.1 TetR/AcrR family transcriptional regulator [Myceligenerans sp. TRM 65318]MBE3016952.1 TetR/AcrR family transcriptional regulator [Myceligenerans sp. TRM 65318]
MARPRTHDDALRTRLLEVASRTTSERGEAAVTVRSVAAEAGTSPSAVYALFGSREKLLAAVTAEGFRRFAEHLAAVPRTADPLADLRALGLAYRTSALADPHFYRVMFERGVERPGDGGDADRDDDTGEPGASPEGDPGGGHVPSTGRSTFGVLRDAVARVLPRASAERVETVALGLWGLVHGLVSLELAGRFDDGPETRARRYAETLGTLGPLLMTG